MTGSDMLGGILPLLWRADNHNCGGAAQYDAAMSKSTSAEVLAANVSAFMRARGLSQESLSKLSGVSKSAIGYVVNYKDASSRHATVETVEALARAFSCKPFQLLISDFADRPAQSLHRVEPRGTTTRNGRGEGEATSEIDVEVLQLVLEQVSRVRGLTAAVRAKKVAEVYALVSADSSTPTEAAVAKLLRSAT